MPRLLLTDDDPYLTLALQKLLSREGYCCTTAATGEQARRVLAKAAEPFDLLLLDVGLPDVDGLTLCREIRRRRRMPILLLTGRSESADKIVGLEAGADDYITKPFDPRELVARVRALLRRYAEYNQPEATEDDSRICLGRLVIDLDAREAFREGQPVHLTSREFELLELLVRHPDKALATGWIFEKVWGSEADLGLKTLTVCIQRLRQKIEADPQRPRLLLTVRGFGYKLASSAE